MSKLPYQDRIVQLTSSPRWMFVHEPIEVVAFETEGRSSVDPTPQRVEGAVASTELLPSRPTRADMMASFRAMQKQRDALEEHEIVLGKIISDESPGSVVADMHQALG